MFVNTHVFINSGGGGGGEGYTHRYLLIMVYYGGL